MGNKILSIKFVFRLVKMFFMTIYSFLRFFPFSLFCLAVFWAFDREMLLLQLDFFHQFCLLSQFVLCAQKHQMKIVCVFTQIFQQLIPELDSFL